LIRETTAQAQGLAIVLWLTITATVALVWFLADLRFEAVHRARYGTFSSRLNRFLRAVGNPVSAPAMLRQDWIERWRARTDAAIDPAVESQRKRSWNYYAAVVAVIFGGLPAAFFLVAMIRNFLPGSVALWIVAVDVIIVGAWVRVGARALRPDPRIPDVAISVAGGVVCVISLTASVVIWRDLT
jgi:hypothetical protein